MNRPIANQQGPSKFQTAPLGALIPLLVVALLGPVTISCSRETSVYSDPSPVAGPITPATTQPSSKLPEQFFDQSINLARATLQPDGFSADGKVIELKTLAGTSATGSFNGPGQGNKALLGLDFWKVPVQQIEPLTFDSKVLAGTESIGLALQIDLLCDGTSLKHLVALGADVSLQSTPPDSDGFSRHTVSIHDSIWSADSEITPSAILNPDDNSVLVPALGNGKSSLTDLLLRYPAACVRNGSVPGSELPLGVPTAAIQWTLGRATTTNANVSHVIRLSVGSQQFDGLSGAP
ncbi:MAG: hypothetical protein J0L82_16540 [Deltaproteobacteria bacterium]|jgi:hypothetical protein|nr:hypothetical protein [Deltaproteobacteria bacterium]